MSGGCIYFLIKDKKIVYVGQSLSFARRLEMHMVDKEFDTIRYIKCDDTEQRLYYEQRWINRFIPKYNLTLPKNRVKRRFEKPNPPIVMLGKIFDKKDKPIVYRQNKGRKSMYDFPTKKGEFISIRYESNENLLSIRMASYQFAKKRGLKFRTWTDGKDILVECM